MNIIWERMVFCTIYGELVSAYKNKKYLTSQIYESNMKIILEISQMKEYGNMNYDLGTAVEASNNSNQTFIYLVVCV